MKSSIKFLLVLLSIFLYTCGAASAQETIEDEQPDYWSLNAHFQLSTRNMGNKDFWSKTDMQALSAYDVAFDFGRESWIANYYFGFSSATTKKDFSTATDTRSLSIREIYAGLRRYAKFQGFRPYVGAGLIGVNPTLDVRTNNETKEHKSYTGGYFLDVGVLLKFSVMYHFGFDFRTVGYARTSLVSVKGDVTYNQVGIFWGYSW